MLVCKMRFYLTLFLYFLLYQPTHCQDEEGSSETEEPSTSFTATDCLSYIYVAWVFFIYAVGLGLDSSQYPQVISYVYLYIPDDCGGYFTGDDAISAQNLLNILLASTNINGNPYNQNPFGNQFGQNQNQYLGQNQNQNQNQFGQNQNQYQSSSTSSLISSLAGIFRSSPQVVSNLKSSSSLARGGLSSSSSGLKYQKSFEVGMKKLKKKDKSIYKLVRKIKNPFDDKGQAVIKKQSVKKQINKKNRKIPCRKMAKKNAKSKQICKSLRKKKNDARLMKKKKSVARKRKLRERKEKEENNDLKTKVKYKNPFHVKNFWNLITG